MATQRNMPGARFVRHVTSIDVRRCSVCEHVSLQLWHSWVYYAMCTMRRSLITVSTIIVPLPTPTLPEDDGCRYDDDGGLQPLLCNVA